MNTIVWLRRIDRGRFSYFQKNAFNQMLPFGYHCWANGKIVLLCFAFLFSTSSIFSQVGPTDSLINEISVQILDLINKNLEKRHENVLSKNFDATDELFNLSEPHLELVSKDLIYQYRMEELKKDVGLNLKGQYFLNYDPIFEDDSGDAFQGTRARLGLEWQIMREGWLAHKAKANRLKNEQKLDKF